MKTYFPVLAIGVMAAFLAACSPKPPAGGNGGGSPPAPPENDGDEPSTPDTADAGPPAAGTAMIAGKVVLKGTPPVMPELPGIDGKPACADQHDTPPKAEVVVTGPGGALVNTFVYVSKGVQGKYKAPSTPVTFNQKKCIYAPHVLGIQVGQDLHISNDDPETHNVHILPAPGIREMNRGQPANSPPITTKFRKAALGVSVKCDVHPWMQAYACVVEHPFFGVTGADGTFKFPEKIPAGTYTITAWHEKYGTSDQEVAIADGETKSVNFEFGG